MVFSSGCASAEQGVGSKVDVVAGGIIEVVVESPTLESILGSTDDQFGNCGEISQFKQGRCDSKIPVVLVDFLLKHIDPVVGTRQAAIASHDPHVVPHKTPNLIPVLGNHNGLMALSDLSVAPLRSRSDRVLVTHSSDGFFGSGIGDDESFE
jgi:hypothetical protein